MSNTLEQWQQQESQVRAKLLPVGLTPPATMMKLSGKQFFEKMFLGEIPPPPIAETLDFVLVEVSDGRAVFQGKPQLRHYNPLGSVHGGWFCTLLDSAVGCAVHTQLPAGKGYTTLELKVNMIRPITKDIPLVRAEGKVIHAGRQTAIAEGQIIGTDGKLYAHATTTCLIFDVLT